MKKILFLMLVSLGLFFCSCSKDGSIEVPPTDKDIIEEQNPGVSSNTKLAKIIAKRSDNFEKELVYTYGKSGFVETLVLNENNKLFEKYVFFYNDKKQLIKKEYYLYREETPKPYITTYVYDVNGVLTSSILKRIFEGTETDSEGKEYAYVTTDTKVTSFSYQNGVLNAMEEKNSSKIEYSNGQPDYEYVQKEVYKVLFTYDKNQKKLQRKDDDLEFSEYVFGDKKSPYIGVFPYSYRLIHSLDIDLGFNIHSYLDFNLISSKRSVLGSGDIEINYSYHSFNSENKPLKTVLNSTNTNESYTVEYIYK